METTLHRQLKQAYAASPSNLEVKFGEFRIDAIRSDELIEIQCASLSALRSKAQRLLDVNPLRIVKPIYGRTRITRLDQREGKVVSRRLSPKRGEWVDFFDELIYFTRVFPHPNLTIELVMVDVEQIRIPRTTKKRWRRNHSDYQVQDIRLESIVETYELKTSTDLLRLIDWPSGDIQWTTESIAKRLSRPRWFAQKVAYVLKHVGAIRSTARNRSGIVYIAA
jgi:hypothetical protein